MKTGKQKTTNEGDNTMLKINWKDQSSNWNREEEYSTMQEAVEAFRATLKGLFAHSGGYVQLLDSDNDDMPVIQWTEGASGGYVSGQAVIDYHPEEDLDECDTEDCAAHSEDHEELCEVCEVKCREICLDSLVRDAK
jgi:hypothetical protein